MRWSKPSIIRRCRTLASSRVGAYLQGMSDVKPDDKPDPPPAKEPEKPELPKEIGGAAGPEPTRYGDWQHKGRVTDF